MKGTIDESKRLQYAMSLDPRGHGFKLDDSMFINHSDDAGFNENDYDPNRMFEVHGEITTHVYRR